MQLKKKLQRWKARKVKMRKIGFFCSPPPLNIHMKSIFDAFGHCLFQGGGVTSYL